MGQDAQDATPRNLHANAPGQRVPSRHRRRRPRHSRRPRRSAHRRPRRERQGCAQVHVVRFRVATGGGWTRLWNDWRDGYAREVGGIPGAGLGFEDLATDPRLIASTPVSLFRYPLAWSIKSPKVIVPFFTFVGARQASRHRPGRRGRRGDATLRRLWTGAGCLRALPAVGHP